MRDFAAVARILAAFCVYEIGLLLCDFSRWLDPDPPQPVPLTVPDAAEVTW